MIYKGTLQTTSPNAPYWYEEDNEIHVMRRCGASYIVEPLATFKGPDREKHADAFCASIDA